MSHPAQRTDPPDAEDRAGEAAPAGRTSGIAVLLAAVLIGGTALVGWWLKQRGPTLHLGTTMPVGGHYQLHLSAWSLLPLGLGAATIGYGRRLAGTLRWQHLQWLGFVAAAAWAVALAVVAGPAAIAHPLTSSHEYLHDVPRVLAMDLGTFLRTFTDHILIDSEPGPAWATHVSGHPPLAVLVFAALAWVGLPQAGWAAALCIVVGAAAVPAILSTVRLLAGEPRARAAAPFVAVAPAALWLATSADALFAGVAAAGVWTLAHAAARRGATADLLAVAGGLVLGVCLYLSYGLVLLAPVVLAVVLLQRRVRPLLVGGAGVVAVAAGFTAAGFWWFDGLALVRERMLDSSAWQHRPGWYFVFANAAALAVVVGPAVVAALPAAWRARRDLRWLAVPAAALLAVAVATASQLSRGEVERIYLPWAVWLLPLAALLPAARYRGWLAAQVGWALLIASTTTLAW